MRMTHLKLAALVALNIVVLAVVIYLSTYTATRSVETPLGTFTDKTEQPYSLANESIPSGVIALWLGLAAMWVIGNLSINAVKEPLERMAKVQ